MGTAFRPMWAVWVNTQSATRRYAPSQSQRTLLSTRNFLLLLLLSCYVCLAVCVSISNSATDYHLPAGHFRRRSKTEWSNTINFQTKIKKN